MFVQTSAPTGWTKSTTHDNKALRIVSGTAGSGGSVAFTTAFASQTPAGTVGISGGSVDATTLSTSQIPAHAHQISQSGIANATGFFNTFTTTSAGYLATSASATRNAGTDNAGGGSSHTHNFTAPTASFTGTAINLAVQYVDVIIATKD